MKFAQGDPGTGAAARASPSSMTNSRRLRRNFIDAGTRRPWQLTRSFRRARWNLTRFFRRWIDHIANLSDLGGRKAADLRVLADDGLICGQINAKRLIVRNVAFEPLDIGAKLAQHAIRLLCRSAELFALDS